MDTIFALATAPGRSGVGVIRISGPEAKTICAGLMSSVPLERGLRRLVDGEGELIDEALVLHFADGASFTGETVIELQTHGSPAVTQALLRRLAELGGRHAEAGEFTRRALLKGRLDLAQVEGLADLIDAETEMQRKQAVRVFSGNMGGLVTGWRSRLIRAASLIEATIDFVDEDVPVDVYPEVGQLLGSVQSEIEEQLAGAATAERIRSGFEVAIVGPPNIGKSTLLNRLAGRSAAITSNIAGTTRDVIEVHLDLGGLPVTFLDTAGLRETTDEVEKLGVALARDRAMNADIRVFLTELGGEAGELKRDDDLVFVGKGDEIASDKVGISGKTGMNVDVLMTDIADILRNRLARPSVAIRERHVLAMQDAREAIVEAVTAAESNASEDLIAFHIRQATQAISLLTGHIGVEDLLDEIFSSFCIGK